MLPRRLERLPRTVLADDAVIHQANTLATRLLGLAFLRELPSGHALFIPSCRSIHTFGMRFPIDVAFVDEHAMTIRIERSVPPRRVLICRSAFAVVESRAGEIARFLGRGPRSVR
jgi:uncharacterized membrane protein (UPF0127 family)